MHLHRRLERLQRLVQDFKVIQQSDYLLCKDMQWSEIEHRVNEAIHPDDGDLMKQIMVFVEEEAATPMRDYSRGRQGELVVDAQGRQVYEQHFFISWVRGLRTGSWSLPKSLPRSWLAGFCSQHGMVRRRCEDCLCGLGNAVQYSLCPICGSANLSHIYLGGPPWDADFIYRPHEQAIQRKKGKGIA